jgi:hypothetical protein
MVMENSRKTEQTYNSDGSSLNSLVEIYRVKAEDASQRRDEAYRFALTISDELKSWRHRYESLRRDLQSAINGPYEGVRQISVADRGHVDIVMALGDHFPGCKATHYIERDEILVGVDKMRERISMVSVNSTPTSEGDLDQIKALIAENIALKNENKILTNKSDELLNSRSWKITKPLRLILTLLR